MSRGPLNLTWSFWVVGVLIIAATIILLVALPADKQRTDCMDGGGRVENVRGGKGGWICIKPERRYIP